MILFSHDAARAHVTPPGHPERVERMEAVAEALSDMTLDRRSCPPAEDGTLLRAPEFDEVDDFAGGLAPVQQLARYAPLRLRWLRPFGVADTGPWTLVGADGRVRTTLDATAVAAGSALADGRLLFPVQVKVGLLSTRRWGFADGEGRLAIPARFEAAGRFAEGLAPVAEGGRFGFVDPEGALQVAPRFDAAVAFSDGRARVRLGALWGYVHPDGSLAAEPAWDAALDASEGLAAVQRDGLWGYLGPDGAIALPLRYAFAAPFQNGLALVRDADGLAYIDTEGDVVWRGD